MGVALFADVGVLELEGLNEQFVLLAIVLIGVNATVAGVVVVPHCVDLGLVIDAGNAHEKVDDVVVDASFDLVEIFAPLLVDSLATWRASSSLFLL